MSKTIYYGASSVDGYLAGPDDDLSWLLSYDGAYGGEEAERGPMEEGGSYERFYESVHALAMGSATYQWILDHLAVGGGEGRPYKGKPTWVLSSRDLDPPQSEGLDIRIADAPVRELYPEMAAASSGSSAVEVSRPNLPKRVCSTRFT